MKYTIWVKRLFIILKSLWIKTLLKGKFISFASFEILNNTKKHCPTVNTIIDVGANKGQFQKAARYHFPEAEIFSFEPIPELYEGLVKNTASNITNFNLALGNEEGQLEFNKNEYKHSSSFYDIADENKNFPSSKTTKIKVEITKLDTIAHQLTFTGKSLLKLDVQGFEMEALKGAVIILKNNIDYIIVEVNFVTLYQNQPSFTQLNAFLNQHNFELAALLDFNSGKDNTYIEADFLYKKTIST